MRWTIEEGLTLIRGLQPQAKAYGYHIALGGGVLNKGTSEKDLDLYFLPLDNKDLATNEIGLIGFLQEIWGMGTSLGDYGRVNPFEVVPADDAFGRVIRQNQDHIDEFIENALFNGIQPIAAPLSYDIETTKAKPVSAYKSKMKFTRSGGDRIDVFIL